MNKLIEDWGSELIIGFYVCAAIVVVVVGASLGCERTVRHEEAMARAGYEQQSIVGQPGSYWVRSK